MSEKKTQTPEELQASLEEANKKVAEYEKLIEELNSEIAAKDEENTKLQNKPVFKIGKKEYKLVIAKSNARFKGQVVKVTAETLKEDKELLKHCIDKGFGCLEEVKKGGE